MRGRGKDIQRFVRVCVCLSNFSFPDRVIEQQLPGNSIHYRPMILSFGNAVSWQQQGVRGAVGVLVVVFCLLASGWHVSSSWSWCLATFRLFKQKTGNWNFWSEILVKVWDQICVAMVPSDIQDFAVDLWLTFNGNSEAFTHSNKNPLEHQLFQLVPSPLYFLPVSCCFHGYGDTRHLHSNRQELRSIKNKK